MAVNNYTLLYAPETGVCCGIAVHYTEPPTPLFISMIAGNPMYDAFLVWNAAQDVPLEPSIPNPVIAARHALKEKAIIDNLPSWSAVGGKFDSMLADAKAATNLAQAKAVLIELIKTQKKIARVLYWDIKNVEE